MIKMMKITNMINNINMVKIINMIRMIKMTRMIITIKVIKVIELIYILWSIKMKFCIDDKDGKYDKDDKDDNDVDNDNDDKYNDVNEHLVKLDSDKTDQLNEVNVNKPDFRSLVCPLGQGQDIFLWGRFRHPGLRLDHRFLGNLLKDLFCSTYLFTGAHFCVCTHCHNLVTLGLPRSHPGEKNGTRRGFIFLPCTEIVLTPNKE